MPPGLVIFHFFREKPEKESGCYVVQFFETTASAYRLSDLKFEVLS